MKEVHIEYFAQLREERGVPRETHATRAATAAELYGEVARAHGLSMPRESLRVAVDQKFVRWDTPLRGGEQVVFVPPVSGG